MPANPTEIPDRFIPVLHEVTPVLMNVMRVEVRRGQSNALITRDRMRVDLIAEFFLRVQPTRDFS